MSKLREKRECGFIKNGRRHRRALADDLGGQKHTTMQIFNGSRWALPLVQRRRWMRSIRNESNDGGAAVGKAHFAWVAVWRSTKVKTTACREDPASGRRKRCQLQVVWVGHSKYTNHKYNTPSISWGSCHKQLFLKIYFQRSVLVFFFFFFSRIYYKQDFKILIYSGNIPSSVLHSAFLVTFKH